MDTDHVDIAKRLVLPHLPNADISKVVFSPYGRSRDNY